jgi:hypothetical protein
VSGSGAYLLIMTFGGLALFVTFHGFWRGLVVLARRITAYVVRKIKQRFKVNAKSLETVPVIAFGLGGPMLLLGFLWILVQMMVTGSPNVIMPEISEGVSTGARWAGVVVLMGLSFAGTCWGILDGASVSKQRLNYA